MALTQNSTGIGTHSNDKTAKTVIAHESPRVWNMDGLNNGKTAPHIDRRTTVAAKALAKYNLYVSIM